MIHHELCEGYGLPACDNCVRLVDRYEARVRAAVVTRIQPMVNPPRCADWIEMPQRAVDSSHEKL